MIAGSSIERALRFLRSRQLAIWSLLFVIAYSFVGTVVPQMAADPVKVAAWAKQYAFIEPLVGMLGLHSAFTAPIFLVPMALLFLSTCACAWERTRTAARLAMPGRGLTEADVRRLSERPQFRVIASSADAATVKGAATLALAGAGLRLKVRFGKRAGEAVGGRWGLAGSPLFHWSLALLFLVIGVGQLTRSEGLLGVPIGYPVPDVVARYGSYRAGAWYPTLESPLIFVATDFQLQTPIGGVDRGPSAVVALREGGAVVASQRVYPNNPLRYRTLMIHQNDYGLAIPIRVEDTTGKVLASAEPVVDFAPKEPSGTTTAELRLRTADGGSHVIDVTVPADREGRAVYTRLPAVREARISVTSVGAATVEETLPVGAALALPNGNLLRVVDLVYYTRLSVVDDWSVYPIYALFVLAGIGISLAVFVPYRAVRLLLVEGPDGTAVHAAAKHARHDPLFAESVETALRGALGAPAYEDPSSRDDPPAETSDLPASDEGA